MRIPLGYQPSFKRKGSRIGSPMLEIGASQETGTGVIQFLFGFQKIWKRLSASAQSLSSRSCLDVVRSLTCTENTLMGSPFHPGWAKVFSEEFQRSSTVGSRVVPCLMLKATTHSRSPTSSSCKDSQQISLLKVSIKPEAGSTPSWSSPLLSRAKLPSRT